MDESEEEAVVPEIGGEAGAKPGKGPGVAEADRSKAGPNCGDDDIFLGPTGEELDWDSLEAMSIRFCRKLLEKIANEWSNHPLVERTVTTVIDRFVNGGYSGWEVAIVHIIRAMNKFTIRTRQGWTWDTKWTDGIKRLAGIVKEYQWTFNYEEGSTSLKYRTLNFRLREMECSDVSDITPPAGKAREEMNEYNCGIARFILLFNEMRELNANYYEEID
jgi:hypothetical protein